MSKYVPGEKKVLDHHVTPAASSAPGCPKSSSFYTGVNLVPVSMAGMATVGNNRHAAAASTAAANRCKTMGPNMAAEDQSRVRNKEFQHQCIEHRWYGRSRLLEEPVLGTCTAKVSPLPPKLVQSWLLTFSCN